MDAPGCWCRGTNRTGSDLRFFKWSIPIQDTASFLPGAGVRGREGEADVEADADVEKEMAGTIVYEADAAQATKTE